ncbi:MAG: signal peptidase II [Patescibacteria group bacterium]
MPVPVYFILIGGLAIVDRVLKIWILSLPDSGGFFVGDLFGIKLFENIGAIFGLPKISPFFEIVVIIIGALLVGTAISAWRKKENLLFLGLILILLGGMSNFLDRLLYGFVVDMIHFGPSVWNAADIMIGAGFALSVIQVLRKRQ